MVIDGKVYYCMRSGGVNEFDLVRRGCLHLWETPKKVISLQGICFRMVVRASPRVSINLAKIARKPL